MLSFELGYIEISEISLRALIRKYEIKEKIVKAISNACEKIVGNCIE